MTPDIGERVAMLENERVHTTAGLLNIQAQISVLSAQVTDLRSITIRNRGFIAGLMAAAGIGGGVIGAKGQAILQFLFK